MLHDLQVVVEPDHGREVVLLVLLPDEVADGRLHQVAVVVGQVGPVGPLNAVPLLMARRRVSGSPIGGIAETQEMLDFCAEKGVLPDVEMIRMDEINQAYDRLVKADVRYRFVIDMATLAAN